MLAAGGCSTPIPSGSTASDDGASKTIYIVSHGWHAGVVLARADIPIDLLPEATDFPSARYLEIGWGDRDYYPAKDPGLLTMLNAVLFPTPGVLHVVGFSAPVDTFFPVSTIVEIKLPTAGFDRLSRHIDASFDRPTGARAATMGPGQYGESRFYPSIESFHLLKTCNVWVANALHAAGLDVSPQSAITARSLVDQARAYGRIVRS